MSDAYSKKLADLEKIHGHQIHRHSTTRYNKQVTIAGKRGNINLEINSNQTNFLDNRITVKHTPIPRRAGLVLAPESTSINAPAAEVTGNVSKQVQTQAAAQLQLFEENIGVIQDCIIAHEADATIGEDCPCARLDASGARYKVTTKCMDCDIFSPVCSNCFVDQHVARYTHWAHVWDDTVGCYVRKDISCLGHVIQLGHDGKPCPNASASDGDIFFHIVDNNGVHDTRLRFCSCLPPVDRAPQLLKHKLFPATMSRPKMAFTFRLLEFYNILHLESKINPYDFIGSIRRMTDNAFTHSVTNPYYQFLLVYRLWSKLANSKRQGHFHDIDDVLVPLGCQPGSLVIACPCCPHPQLNMEPTWRDTPRHLRHINQHLWTMDGNFQLSKFAKNTDPNDVSIYKGLAYFPLDEQYQAYLKKLPKTIKEKVICDHLKALEKQNRKKFKNLEVTGVVQVQCSHVLVKSTADLQLGEKFGNTDHALAMAIRQHNVEELLDDAMGLKISYDISCGYAVNVSSRFNDNFPELADVVDKATWLIPLLHIQNHKSDCMYLYSSSYTEGAGHFHGETAEMVWAESNQLGAQTRQMNLGHRQDTIINATSDWNWKKVANMANSVMNDICRAKALYESKRDIFKALTDLYRDHVPQWNQADRTAHVSKKGKDVDSVYRQKTEKLVSQSRVYELMLEDDANAQREGHDGWNIGKQSSGDVATFLCLGLSVLSAQRRLLLQLEQRGKSTKRQVSDGEIVKERGELWGKIEKLRAIQKGLTPQVETQVTEQHAKNKHRDLPEQEVLYLPSDFAEHDRLSLGLIEMADQQRKLTEGGANDAILRVQKLVKVLSNTRMAKKSDGVGQVHNTRATAIEMEVSFKLDLAIRDYNDLRQILLKLGVSDEDPVYRPLTLDDTFRKPTMSNRNLGDTYRNDGPLWAANTGVTGGARPPVGSQVTLVSSVATQTVRAAKRKALTTQQVKNKKQKTESSSSAGTSNKARTEDGWIWRFTGRAHLSSKELQKYLDEGDRVQWFRAEAEKDRWLEEWEIRQADYLRCIRFFRKWSEIWKGRVVDAAKGDSIRLGKNAYARKKGHMFADMEKHAIDLLIGQGYGHLLNNRPLYEHLDEVRALPENIISYEAKSTVGDVGDSTGERVERVEGI